MWEFGNSGHWYRLLSCRKQTHIAIMSANKEQSQSYNGHRGMLTIDDG